MSILTSVLTIEVMKLESFFEVVLEAWNTNTRSFWNIPNPEGRSSRTLTVNFTFR